MVMKRTTTVTFLVVLVSFICLFCEATWVNCIGNQTCNPSHYYEPKTLSELQTHLKDAVSEGSKVRVVGGGYSISDLVCTDGYLLNLRNFNHILSVDQENALVHVEAGITMQELNERLGDYGLALSNQAAIECITLGGAIATAVHGTGHTSTLSSFIRNIELMTADGIMHSLSLTSDVDAYAAARVSLGALGVVYAVTLQCEPLFYLKADHEVWDINTLMTHYKELNENNDFFQFSWNIESGKAAVTRLNRDYLSNDSEICYKALACYTIDDNDKDLFSEIAVPIDSLPIVLGKIEQFVESYQNQGITIADVVVRFVEADKNALLSPAADRAVAYMTMSIPKEYERLGFYEGFEALLQGYQGRPHWGKTNFLDNVKASSLYGENLEKFISVKRRLDPLGVFSNGYIDRVCGSHGSTYKP